MVRNSTYVELISLMCVFLNSDFYPYNDMNLDFEHKKAAILYDMYVKYQKTYYGYNNRDAMLSISCTRSIRSDRLFSPKRIDKMRYCGYSYK